MTDAVLDASAVLAFLNHEPGGETVSAYLPGGHLSTVNAAEVAAKLVDGGATPDEAGEILQRLGAVIVAFESVDVLASARIRAIGQAVGLSLGDRACLATAERLGRPAITADRAWRGLDLGIEIHLIR